MRLIDADALKEEVNKKKVVGRFNTLLLIDNAPTVENITVFCEHANKEELESIKKELEKVIERPQGEWIRLHTIGDYKCSICGAENLYKYTDEHERWIKTNSNFCPNCGADMREGNAV